MSAPDEDQRAAALSTALSKLPAYVGPVWRSCDLPAGADTYTVADVVHEPAFVSATRDPAVALPGGTTYVIGSRTGKDIDAVVGGPDAEVVLDRDALFLVLAVDAQRDRTTVYLDELPRDLEPTDLATTSPASRDLLAGLRAAEDERRAVPTSGRRPTRAPGKYAFPVGMSDTGELRRIVAGHG